MDIFTLARYLHFVSIIGISGTLIASLIVLKSQMSKGELKQLSKIDGLYGLSAIVAVAAV
ncbi:MAG: DUF2214 family protein, partial [Cyclobacteriaceae bacterium]|nr:DUF2214 family protein [Cyclobacteriaceae bacterium HetDA_MAG_MS6]